MASSSERDIVTASGLFRRQVRTSLRKAVTDILRLPVTDVSLDGANNAETNLNRRRHLARRQRAYAIVQAIDSWSVVMAGMITSSIPDAWFFNNNTEVSDANVTTGVEGALDAILNVETQYLDVTLPTEVELP